jgi:uncharacterized membrane protein
MDNSNPPGNGKPADQDRTLKDLTPNTAALLCYVGGWVSGIVLLILEQKNRFIRFHALQSIILFGSLTVAHIVLSQIPFVGKGFSGLIFVIGAIFWILMMIKAYAGESYKVLWAGNLAEKLANDINPPASRDSSSPAPAPAAQPQAQANNQTAAQTASQTYASPPPPPPPPPPAQPQMQPLAQPEAQSSSRTSDQASDHTPGQQTERGRRQDRFRAHYYSFRSRAARITGSAFAIAWSIALIIFFNFFSNYIGYYKGDHQWQTLITSDFPSWLPFITVNLILVIVGHTILIIFDKHWLRQVIEIVLSIFGLVSIISLLTIFPFDFSVLPNPTASYWAWLGLKIFLILICVGTVIGVIVRFIRFIVDLAEGRY